MSEEFSDELFARLFGYCILRPSEETLEKAREINKLFDALRDELTIETLDMFRRAGRTDAEHLFFLSNVASCPEDVIEKAQRALAPDSPERLEFEKKKKEPPP
jgi:hypothetical protein